eukprot:TRINITY_DN3008_c0_g1_i1.p1 TRINITY_DN3008_c0_g1~~TRINITY_DN3008_c0_g1_i1.p1  ORF type:complete len:557 (+),score=203.13 TRINITY_DN3008_c0_g1_i1:108-1673(+)
MGENNKKRKVEEEIEKKVKKEEWNEEEEELEEERGQIAEMSNSELKSILLEGGIDCSDIVERKELQEKALNQLKEWRAKGIYRKKRTNLRRDCPFLDSIKRRNLDFDFEKVCSVTLQNLNVYACLVCGKFFQGRGKSSQAYLHSLQADHHVFINLDNEKVYCLPDDYEVEDSSLADIKYVLNPKFTPDQIKHLDSKKKSVSLIDNSEYLPGFVGLNNIKSTDWLNVVVQSLIHVVPFRDFFMSESNYITKTKDPLVLRFGELVRKLYNPKNFKAHVDPHELIQAVSNASNKKFTIGQTSDPIDFIQFFLNTLHKSLHFNNPTTGKKEKSIIHKVFQGKVEVVTESNTNPQPRTDIIPFLYLTLDVPPPPLFKDEAEQTVIPKRPIFDLLEKFDGKTVKHFPATGERKRFRLIDLPQYLVCHIKRFTKNNFFVEKNPTIITCPLKNLDVRDYLSPNSKYKGPTRYDLIASIIHDSENSTYRVDVLNSAADQWYEIHDLVVKEIISQQIAISESYIQIFQRQK